MDDQVLPDTDELLARLAANVRSRLARRTHETPLVIGIRTGGLWVAEQLAAKLGIETAVGSLDIGFYRDDFSRSGLTTTLTPSHLPWPIDGCHLLLVDDVLCTGRTIRAAINEIFDYGRPASITLAVLVARDGRELPIEADAVGAEMALPAGASLKLRGPNPLRLELVAPGKSQRVSHA